MPARLRPVETMDDDRRLLVRFEADLEDGLRLVHIDDSPLPKGSVKWRVAMHANESKISDSYGAQRFLSIYRSYYGFFVLFPPVEEGRK